MAPTVSEILHAAEIFPYVYRWNRNGRKGQRCAVPVRGTFNSCLVVFADGYKMVTIRSAIKKAPVAENDERCHT